MPGKIKVKVLAGRNLPVMDRAGDTTDAFVEIKFGGVTHKTDVCRKSLNPHWNSTEWYRFEVDESELQDEPLQLRLMDHDTYSANDAIGKVVISLAPLLARDTAHTNKTPAAATPSGAVMSGWIPVLDTMHGIRGELNVIVKVELFSDFNKYKTSSCGVQFFHCPMIPPGYRASAIHGFVEELVVNDDPEYQWIDKIRTPRASNEARQVAFIKLGNQVQRLVGLKAAELGANAVVGYQQDFDLEGEAGVVARAIGTAVSITPLPTPSIPTNIPPCSQHQLKQYLDILSTDNENIPDLNQYFSTHQDELQKLVSILHPKYSSNFLDEGENPDDEEPSNSLMRQSSIKSYTDSVSIYQDEYASHKSFQTITEDQTDLNKLLNRIEKDNSDADSDSSGPMQTIKKIKSNFFVKKLGSLRRKSDKSEKSNKTNERDDTVSIKSNSSDTSKISLSDLKNEFKKRLKKPKFRKPQFKNLSDQGVGMASILARSVIHAHTSLACIAETQDSETSPASTLRRTSESEPTINMTDEEIQKLQPKIVPEIFEEDDYESGPPVDRCVSLKDINLEQDKNVLPVERPRKTSESCPSTPVAARQENLLALPGNESYFGSASSVVSGESSEMYSSSEGSEDSSDLKTDTDRSIETTSSVVHTVLAHDVNPTLVEQMERKLSIISGTTPEPEPTPTDQNREPSNAPEVENNKNELRETEKASTSTDAKPEPQRKFFDDVNEKLEKVEVARKSIDELKPEQKYDPNQNKIPPVDGSDKKAVQSKTWSQDPSDSNLENLNIVKKDDPRTLSKDPSVSNLEATEPTDPEILSENNGKKSGESDSKNGKKLTRQDSVHSTTESERKMSNESESNIVIPCKSLTQCGPMLQHFHPIMSGSHAPLETIPSLPESSSVAQSLDLDDDVDINCVSVCDNTHAACSDIVGRSERDRDREKERDRGSPRHTRHESCGKEMTAVAASALNSSLNSTSTPVGMHRRSSDSDLSITPKAGSSLNASGNTGSGGGAILRPSMNSNNLELLEYPFLTMSHYPHGFIVNIGGCVCARSVKLVDGGSALAMRAAWWAELRTEVRAHARALRCNALLAYKETANICEDVCVLSASGTAAVINLDCDLNTEIDANIAGQNGSKTAVDDFESLESCGVAHIPYSPAAAPSSERYHCGHCRRARVPSVLLATCAKPNRLTSHSKAITLTAVAARARRAPPQSEPGARDISDQLPFLEYELHKLLLAKLRMQGANAIFNLQTQIAIGERCVMALASGTAVRLAALPPPTPPRIKASEKDKDALDIQRALWDAFTANKAANGYDIIPDVSLAPLSLSDAEEPPALELCADKDAALLELDEAEDVETARSLAVRRQHMPVFCYGMKPKAAAPPQAFVQVIRARFPLSSVGGATVAAERHVARALDVVTYKLRRLSPAALIEPAFQLELPEDEIQLVLSGAALQLQDPNKPEPATNGTHDVSNNNGTPADGPLVHSQASGDGDDEIFALDEEQAPRQEKVTESFEEKNVVLNGQVPTTVSLTSQAVIPGARIVRRICLLRLLFVRETTTVRELGGLSGFLHALTSEVMAIVRAYTAALGGNALTSFYITQLMLQDNAHKNQGQCLMSVGGDVVHITY